MEKLILDFLKNDVGGVSVTDEEGELLYRDANAPAFDGTPEENGCPPAGDCTGPVRWEYWDILRKKVYTVCTRSASFEGRTVLLHQFTDVSEYLKLYSVTNAYTADKSRESEEDAMTGLSNKGKYIQMMKHTFPSAQTLAIFNMDVNNLKTINDARGHEAGDILIRKAAESIKRVLKDNIYGFRVGGDEFVMVATGLSEEESNDLKKRWEAALEDVNAGFEPSIHCVIACGMAYGEGSDDPEILAKIADGRMYEDKKKKKAPGEEIR
ncbi:MAG: GGDEF domain-containing protein [Lachnospiraceae bacterium]|nr:GGDEF domain-containing protein [Lachnospiraceae bacterium]